MKPLLLDIFQKTSKNLPSLELKISDSSYNKKSIISLELFWKEFKVEFDFRYNPFNRRFVFDLVKLKFANGLNSQINYWSSYNNHDNNYGYISVYDIIDRNDRDRFIDLVRDYFISHSEPYFKNRDLIDRMIGKINPNLIVSSDWGLI